MYYIEWRWSPMLLKKKKEISVYTLFLCCDIECCDMKKEI